MNRRRMFRVVLICMMFAATIHANSIHPKAGTRYFPFLKLTYDARSLGMGKAQTAMPNGLYGVVSNPAALGFIEKRQLFLTYSPVILDISSGALGYGLATDEYGILAAHMLYLSYGTIQPKNEQNEDLPGTIHPYSFCGGFSWARVYYSSLSVGISIKGVYDQLSEGIENSISSYSADGFGCDIGAQYTAFSSRLIYGLVIRNIGFIRSTYTAESNTDGLPLSFASGVSYILKSVPYVRYAFDLEKPIDDYLQYHCGLEINAYRQIFSIRSGYNFSHEDLRQFLRMLRNGSFDDDFTKTNWSLFCAGFGLTSSMQQFQYKVDAAVNLRTNGINPEFIMTLMLTY
ncbi:MAG: PorV/PorQ family protein [Chitinivibrionales bacterium]|nr:PorV/PorQ family protein [Chitinivibrionales bacterium]